MSTVRTRADAVLGRREAGAELGRGLADRRRAVASRPGRVRGVELVEGAEAERVRSGVGMLDDGHRDGEYR